jgi:predicted Zn-dependent protease with MMP-like domain
MIDYEEFTALAQRIYREVRENFYRKARGLLFASKVELPESLIISRSCEYDRDLPGAVILGRFEAVDFSGLHAPSFAITLYYGSFAKEFSYASKERIEAGLFETIVHEIIHYYEAHLGTRELSKMDLEFKRDLIERYMEEKMGG